MENSVNTVMLVDANGKLRSSVFASRPGIAVATKVDDCVEGQAVKVVASGLSVGDFVVRSVLAGNRRVVHLLSGTMPAFADCVFNDGQRAEFADGEAVVEIPGATLVAAPKKAA